METTCGKPLESFETIHVAGEGLRCYRCFNNETAERLGINFDEPRFQPIVLQDAPHVHHPLDARTNRPRDGSAGARGRWPFPHTSPHCLRSEPKPTPDRSWRTAGILRHSANRAVGN